MKKFLIIPVILLLTIASCKKSSTSSSGVGTINATIDGTVTTFNVGAQAKDTLGILDILGLQSASGTGGSIGLGLEGTGSAITTGTYTDTSSTKATITYTQGGTTDYLDSTAVITITAISTTNVQGTFSGTVVAFGGGTPASHKITNGNFNLNLTP